ncbi:MAG: DNA alkylation repair protein [Chloroflexi bacterium]|nr:DNA alkylation repair protein [Chloroflexota bacterium]
MPKPQPDWLTDFAAAVERDDAPAALALLEERATPHAGTPEAADKRAAAATALRVLGDRPDDLLRWLRWLAGQTSPTAKEIVALLVPHTYDRHPGEARKWLLRLCDDGNWEVREWAAGALGELLDKRFDEMYPLLAGWAAHPSQFVRRAVVVAAKEAVKARRPDRCEPLFRLVEPLLGDRAEEVRRNLGPFAVGGGFLRAYPQETLARVRRWAESEDEMVRWNAAMVFVAAEAAKHVDAALEVLSALASDRRRLVWQAVASALRNLAKRQPERVAPVLRTWLDDERKLPAALALRGTSPRSS